MSLRHQETINQFYKWREKALARKQERLDRIVEGIMYGVEDRDSIVPDPDADTAPLDIESGE